LKTVSNETAQQTRPHGLVAKVLHWGTAGLLLFAYIQNGDVTNALRDPAAMRMEALLGLGIVAVFALRFLWMQRWNGGATRLPASAPWWEQRLSRLAHYSLYLCVLAIVASGLLIAGAQSWGSPFLVDAASGVHEFIAGTTLFVIGGHVAAALWHKLVRRDGVWESIGTPWWVPRLGWFKRGRAGAR
jgi:cytochrome b561